MSRGFASVTLASRQVGTWLAPSHTRAKGRAMEGSSAFSPSACSLARVPVRGANRAHTHIACCLTSVLSLAALLLACCFPPTFPCNTLQGHALTDMLCRTRMQRRLLFRLYIYCTSAVCNCIRYVQSAMRSDLLVSVPVCPTASRVSLFRWYHLLAEAWGDCSQALRNDAQRW